ncbi:MAG: Type 1 glutamine amidotransferase-like domain-containing protein [Candidatus Micrarchaeaceae archaeon]|jgi:dipeptidase E
MKILITSTGITNKSISNALKELVGKNVKIKIAFIPTAANESDGEKDWLIKNYNECEKVGTVDIVDISALKKKSWFPRLKEANVIVVGGGWTAYLMEWFIKSGLKNELPKLLKTRVYVGISAGGIILAKTIQARSEFLYGDEVNKAPAGLSYINFNFRPHLNSPYFPKVRDKYLKTVAERLTGDLYALDDNSAIIYINGKIKVVSEGKWKKYSKSK